MDGADTTRVYLPVDLRHDAKSYVPVYEYKCQRLANSIRNFIIVVSIVFKYSADLIRIPVGILVHVIFRYATRATVLTRDMAK
jgi:hypothetical protein